ncbi:hypothetical protein PG996_015215 [Apiospora saccharicola]|uniref:Pantothenate transporter liz1 n=1 Tax=Apiospora saccharicola TaxID=335842 RepID=A0ABR1TMN4_9PEZI
MDSKGILRKVDSDQGQSEPGVAETPAGLPLRKTLWSVLWDSLDKTPEERKFIAKIDWWILSYCCVSYFVKHLDQTNISNAYVSGMKEDLFLTGNDLNLLTTFGTLVMGMAGAKNVETLHALRFFTGLLEASAYPGIMTLLGNFYTPSELGKRACIFQASFSAAQMFSGYLQAALFIGMNGKHGVAAWRWLFIFDGIIGVPVALYGYFAVSDSPTTSRASWLKPKERETAIARMERVGRKPMKKLTWRIIREIVTSWPVYLFCAIFIVHVLGIRIYSYMNLWLKATKLYTTEEINIIPTAGYGLDALGLRWPVIIFACLVALVGTAILSVYPEHDHAAMMAGWLLTFCETGAGALIVTWINGICSHSADQRAIIIGVVETAAFTFQAWVPPIDLQHGGGAQVQDRVSDGVGVFRARDCIHLGDFILLQKVASRGTTRAAKG